MIPEPPPPICIPNNDSPFSSPLLPACFSTIAIVLLILETIIGRPNTKALKSED